MISQKKDFNVHFIGVGGVSMSWLATYFKEMGFCVSGSDKSFSENVKRLKENGIEVFIGHSEENLGDSQVVVYSDAISEDNVELKRARKDGKYLLSRADALRVVAENFSDVVGVIGCHGKTTTACMLAHIFRCANLKFTAHIGGEDCVLGNYISQGSNVFLSEVCEFKKNINLFSADYAVCVNTGKDHMDCYEDEEELKSAYVNFTKRAYKSIINKKDEVLSKIEQDNAIGFSLENGATYTAKGLVQKNGKYSFDVYKGVDKKGSIDLSVYGRHNVENALAASVCAIQMGIDFRHIKRGLKNFKGVKRRFEKIGKINGADVIADYAHHPTEILACLKTAYEVSGGKLYVAFQPHTYTRTLYLKEEFLDVLSKIKNLALFKTFSARENYQKGGGAYDLHLLLDGSKYFDDVDALVGYYEQVLKKKDTLLVLGAGDLYYLVKDKIGE